MIEATTKDLLAKIGELTLINDALRAALEARNAEIEALRHRIREPDRSTDDADVA